MTLRSVLFSLIAVGGSMMLSSATANAQQYANPTSEETQTARRQGPCRDPWVSMAIRRVMGRAPQGQGDFGECNYRMYNNGSWNSYNELAQAVKLALGNVAKGGVRFEITRAGVGAAIKVLHSGTIVDTMQIKLIGQDGASLVTESGSTIVAAGGGNYTVQSVGNEKRINLGKSVLIIKIK